MDRKLNFVMISPHFPKNYETFAHRLKEAGINTLGIADASYDELSDGLKSALTEYYKVDDMNDYDQLYRAVGYFAHKYGKIDRIESHNEYWLETDAKLRTDFNVFGFKDEDMESVKTKSKMKEIFRKNKIPVAKGRVFTDDKDARILSSELGFPVIVKPNSGVGSSDTYKIKSKQELEEFFTKKSPDVIYIMEEYIEGDVVTFDGLVDRDGNVVFSSTIVYSNTVLDIISDPEDMYYFLPREIPRDLSKLGEKCVKAFGLKERFFHFEFFRTKSDGKLMGLEVNCRPPGGLTIDMFNYANDFDIFKEYANLVKFNEFRAEITRPYNCLYAARKGHKNYVHSIDDIKNKYGENLVDIQSVPGVFSAIMGNEGYIFKTTDLDKMFEIIQYLRKTN
ncbi:ATP-grasp domain-containing protein [Gemelliphila palaticanis]|uniref:ATP-grasp domain-containing protein n=1 Tax=Gemelliphila palaticanis TaxID=81950 RepID=A0ABX2T3B6_9BACL|nr:ATP-grasp domain-containing protein [Gemella palaticanis]MBF0716188.1 ATP-grasp domain-containing protein [Gemella palaticanis]NYS48118.1 ATP-grasp domain-containing protein [Gemella palaticanis]